MQSRPWCVGDFMPCGSRMESWRNTTPGANRMWRHEKLSRFGWWGLCGLPHDFPTDPRMRVSPESLSAEIGGQGPREGQLRQYLPSALKKSGKRGGRTVHSDRIRWRGSMHDLPVGVQSRTMSLHGESESIVYSGPLGKTRQSGRSRFFCAAKIPAIP